MELGLNLSFATKRWLKPHLLAKMCKEDFNISRVQFTWDLIDPWWPDEPRNRLAVQFKEAFENEGLEIKSTFGGVASYTMLRFLLRQNYKGRYPFSFLKERST
ncbi:MAG: hypothetical protein Q8865_00525 [Bacillota bacterium]|nr:hypothetical protein [Bacillota bacterium]